MKKISNRQQSGFTLVEIAIVLVIIGLLLGGVLKGTELIENSKVKRIINDINGVSAAYNAYIDRYRRVPGDDGPLATLQARGGSWASVTQAPTTSNGALDAGGTSAVFNPNAEGEGFWQHLRAAGYISGDPSAEGTLALPVNAFGGFMGVTLTTTQGSLTGIKVCSNRVTGKAALAIDNQIDDGASDSGNVQATLSTTTSVTTAATVYDEEQTYVVCARL